MSNAWGYLERSGVPSESCYPYTSGISGNSGLCTAGTCADGSTWRVYTAVRSSTKKFSGITAIQTEIMTNGPVSAVMQVYQDFQQHYQSGVYTRQYGAFVGGHAVKIIGWGTDPQAGGYWICANSWGTNWGSLGGYFWIKYGQCGIESDVYAGLAVV